MGDATSCRGFKGVVTVFFNFRNYVLQFKNKIDLLFVWLVSLFLVVVCTSFYIMFCFNSIICCRAVLVRNNDLRQKIDDDKYIKAYIHRWVTRIHKFTLQKRKQTYVTLPKTSHTKKKKREE